MGEWLDGCVVIWWVCNNMVGVKRISKSMVGGVYGGDL